MYKYKPRPLLALTDNPELSTTYRAVHNWFGETDPLTKKLGKFLISELWDTGRYTEYRNHVILKRSEAERAKEALGHMCDGYAFHEPAISGLGRILQWNMGDRIQAAVLLGRVPPIELPGQDVQLPYLGAVQPDTANAPGKDALLAMIPRQYIPPDVKQMVQEVPNLRALLTLEQRTLVDTFATQEAA